MDERESFSIANALYSLALESGEDLSLYKEELHDVVSFLFEEKGEETLRFFSSEVLPFSRKEMVLSTFLSSSKTKHLKGFLTFLLDKHLLSLLPKIETEFRTLANKKLCIEEGIVHSVSLLSKEEIQAIESAFEKKKNIRCELANRIDKSLIGGVRVYLGEKLYDSSIEGKIEALRQSLLKGDVL